MPVRTAFMDNELGFVATESGVWVRYGLGVWHYADGSWEQITYRDPDTGAMPEGVFWGIGDDDTALYRHDATGWQHWSLKKDRMLASWSRSPHGVAPDGSFWAAWPGRGALGTPDCLGVNRFDGRAWERYLPDMYVHPLGMDIAPDGSVWLIAWEDKGVDDLRLLVRRTSLRHHARGRGGHQRHSLAHLGRGTARRHGHRGVRNGRLQDRGRRRGGCRFVGLACRHGCRRRPGREHLALGLPGREHGVHRLAARGAGLRGGLRGRA